jgi:hypothetical protein
MFQSVLPLHECAHPAVAESATTKSTTEPLHSVVDSATAESAAELLQSVGDFVAASAALTKTS